MNTSQKEFVASRKDHAPAIKAHRICYDMPWWLRDGYEDEAAARRARNRRTKKHELDLGIGTMEGTK